MPTKARIAHLASQLRHGVIQLAALLIFTSTTTLAGPPDPQAGEQAWLRGIRPLTRTEMGFTRAGEAYFSADQNRISFQAIPAGGLEYQIYVAEVSFPADGPTLSNVAMISSGEGATTCSWFHPSGRTLIYASNHLDTRPAEPPPEVRQALGRAAESRYTWPFQPGMDIFEYTFATRELRRLTDTEGYDAEGSLSPDGRLMVFTSMRDGNAEIYVSAADGRNARRITHAPGYDGGAFFSPDGKQIVYRSDRKNLKDGTLQIFVNNLEGTAERALTNHETLHWCPFWHPSGKWLIYTRGDHPHDGPPTYDLYLLRADGAEQHRVTFDRSFDGLPAFSPDGRWLLWSSRRGGLETPHVFIAEFMALRPDGSWNQPW